MPPWFILQPIVIPLPTTRNHDIHVVRNANSCRRDILRQIRMDHNAYIMESNLAPTWIILSSDDTPGWNCAKFTPDFSSFQPSPCKESRCLLNVLFFIYSFDSKQTCIFIFRIVDRIFIVWIFRFSYYKKKEWRWRCKASKDCLKYMNINDSRTPLAECFLLQRNVRKMLEEFVAFILLKRKKKKKNVIHRWDDYLNNIVELMGWYFWYCSRNNCKYVRLY